MTVSAVVAPGSGPGDADRLRTAVRQLEGVFVEQLFKAMRETVPEGGVVETGPGEEMFAGLLDQRLAEVAPTQWRSALSDALMRQLNSATLPAPTRNDGAVGPRGGREP